MMVLIKSYGLHMIRVSYSTCEFDRSTEVFRKGMSHVAVSTVRGGQCMFIVLFRYDTADLVTAA